jgi:hypothetical protein
MKLTLLSLLALSACAVHARFIEKHETDQVVLNELGEDVERYLIELEPGHTMLVTEEEKWELKRVLIPSSPARTALTIFRRMASTSWISPIPRNWASYSY